MKQTSQSLLVPIFILLISTTSAFAYYNPQAGRFMQRDPLGIDPAGGKQNPFNILKQYKDGMSLYEYVSSRPTLNQDPYGFLCSGTKTTILGIDYYPEQTNTTNCQLCCDKMYNAYMKGIPSKWKFCAWLKYLAAGKKRAEACNTNCFLNQIPIF